MLFRSSLAVGVKAYCTPTVAVVGGDPEIVGGRLAAGLTLIANTGSDVVLVPSLTLIATFENVPAAVGVPCSCPVDVLNVAHAGRLTIENVSVLPSGSLAVGVKAYCTPTVAVVGGDPEIVGGRLAAGLTLIAKIGRAHV